MVNHLYETSDKTAFATTATSSAVYAGVLWLLHRSAIQHVVTFATVWFGRKHPPTSLPPAGDSPDSQTDRRRAA